MNDSANVFLGVIAVATLLIAIVQIGVLVVAGLLARRVARLTKDIERQLKPLTVHVDSIGREAARAAALATAQVERVDRLFADVSDRVELGLDTVQAAMSGPAREAAAIWSACRAALSAIKNAPVGRRKRSRAEDEDALFI